MNTTGNRLAKLRRAKDVVEQLDEDLGGQGEQQIQRIRSDLQMAGNKIGSAGYERYMENALGRAAGIAIARDLDDVADRATRILDDEIELSAEPLAEVERETDDRGRITLGSRWGDQRVRVAVLGAEEHEEESDE